MRLLQRVSTASVTVDDDVIGEIGPGLGLVCAMQGDRKMRAQLVHKISRLRIFRDDAGKMNRSVSDIGGAGWWSASSRWVPTPGAARPFQSGPSDEGKRLYHCFCDKMRDQPAG